MHTAFNNFLKEFKKENFYKKEKKLNDCYGPVQQQEYGLEHAWHNQRKASKEVKEKGK